METSRRRLPGMVRFALMAASVYVVGKSVSSFSPGSILGVLEDVGFLALTVPIIYYFCRALVRLKNRVLWKVRNRILISYTFVAVFPLFVLGLVATLALLLTFRTMSGFYLERELDSITDDLDEANQRIFHAYYRDRNGTDDSLDLLSESVSSVLGDLPMSLGSLSVGIYSKRDSNQRIAVLAPSGGGRTEFPGSLPPWIQDGFVDLVTESPRLFFLNVSEIGNFIVVGRMPFDERVIEYLKRRTSIEIKLARFTPGEKGFEVENREFRSKQDFFSITWVHFYTPVVWQSGESESRVIFLSIPLETLLSYFFERFTDPRPMVLLAMVAALFVLTMMVSLVIGATLARSITRSVHNIYAGAKSIQAGDFDFRIPSKDRDQLDAMASSFNRMSASIVELMRDVSDKERLEKEIEIAKEVQKQLFPQQLPPTKNLELAASCIPARQVSGDYYDFLPSGDTELDIVVGDISGKGISAALMMASIQSLIRSKLGGGVQPEQQTKRMAEAVAELNRQIYHRSSPETYSTLILNHFSSQTRRLSYCNAGHHPPLLFSDGEVSDLAIGGTVVGLFENWNYESAEVELKPGDLVVYFTDGVVEAESDGGEEFGRERLIDLIRSDTFLTAHDIQSLILEQVFEWIGSQEQADDITVVCLKVIG